MQSFITERKANRKTCGALLNDCVFDRLPAVSCKTFLKVHLRVKLFWIEARVKLKETGKRRRSF